MVDGEFGGHWRWGEDVEAMGAVEHLWPLCGKVVGLGDVVGCYGNR